MWNHNLLILFCLSFGYLVGLSRCGVFNKRGYKSVYFIIKYFTVRFFRTIEICLSKFNKKFNRSKV